MTTFGVVGRVSSPIVGTRRRLPMLFIDVLVIIGSLLTPAAPSCRLAPRIWKIWNSISLRFAIQHDLRLANGIPISQGSLHPVFAIYIILLYSTKD